jgi:hypothetical protein
MWLYDQISGALRHRSKETEPWVIAGIGYAGNGDGLNNPMWQGIRGHGPLPRGAYTIVPAKEPHLGPVVFALQPNAGNQMFGRSAFYIHWDNANHNYSASEGCICMRDALPFSVLSTFVNSGDNQLTVTETPPLLSAPPV